MANLSTIIQQTAGRMLGVSVDVDSSMGTVCISDTSGEHDDIFMQGDDATSFINEMEALYEQTGDLNKDTIALHLASPYVECIWE